MALLERLHRHRVTGRIPKPSRRSCLPALLIRTGRSSEYKRDLLKRLWDLLQSATGAPDDQMVIGIQEVPASQAMEMGRIMPDVAEPPVRSH